MQKIFSIFRPRFWAKYVPLCSTTQLLESARNWWGSLFKIQIVFFFCHLFSYRRCGTLEIAWIQRGASRHSAPSTWSSNFHPQHNWSSTIWLEHLRLYMAVYHYLDYDHSHSHHHDHHHGHHDQLPMCPPDMRSASSKARCTSGSTAPWRPAPRWDIQMISKVKPFKDLKNEAFQSTLFNNES